MPLSCNLQNKQVKCVLLTTGLQADKTLLGSTRLCRVQLKVKLLLCKFDRGDNGGLCGKGDQRGRHSSITRGFF